MNQNLSILQKIPEIIQEIIPEPIQTRQHQQDDKSNQKFFYYLANRNKNVHYPNQVSIDYSKAESEISSLDWTYQINGISIINMSTDENIFCSRLKDDKYFVLTPVLENGLYTGYQWTSYPDAKSLLHTLRAFFDEMFWFGTLEWTQIRWESNFQE